MFTPHNLSHVTCRMSRVTCHVTCHISHVTFFSFFSFCEQSGEAYPWRVCYQQGLPRLVKALEGFRGTQHIKERPKLFISFTVVLHFVNNCWQAFILY